MRAWACPIDLLPAHGPNAGIQTQKQTCQTQKRVSVLLAFRHSDAPRIAPEDQIAAHASRPDTAAPRTTGIASDSIVVPCVLRPWPFETVAS